MFSLYYYMNLIKLIKYGKLRNYDRLSRLKSVSSIDDDYFEAATGGGLKNFVIFTGKRLCWSLFLIKLQACKFIEKRLQQWRFPLHVREFLRTSILKNIKRLLVIILLVQQFICFRKSIYNYKEKLIFWWRKCSLKLDYAIEWHVFKDHVKIVKMYMVKINVSILDRLIYINIMST